uniref:Uncharacterized protein n=1 Tax=Labrus bergylta TaxID=56723 RepID=A0A3Q3M8P2_9LABR
MQSYPLHHTHTHKRKQMIPTISRSGLQHLGPPQPSLPPASNGPNKELRTYVDWTENAVNGDHLWMETSCSGELCYLGEDTCLLKTRSHSDVSLTVCEGEVSLS